jgi:hypothetical protein
MPYDLLSDFPPQVRLIGGPLIAPWPHLSLAGLYDPLTPSAGLDRIDHELREAPISTGALAACRLSSHVAAHLKTAAMRAEVIAFLQQWLWVTLPSPSNDSSSTRGSRVSDQHLSS